MNTPLSQDDAMLAAEYVLRLLDGKDLEDAQERSRVDAGFAKLVFEWRETLSSLDHYFEEEPPSPTAKTDLMQRLFGIAERQSIWDKLPLWRIVTAAIAVIALGLGYLMYSGQSVDMNPQFQAELSTADGSLVLVAGVIPPTHEIVIERIVGAAPEGRVRELWLIAQGASGPVSLGLLEANGSTRIRVPDDIAPGVRTGTIAISEEPFGGSPTGAPTGPVVATATFEDI
jgi:anti-sigma-K factor RskA